MNHLIWHRQPKRELRSPILVTAWDGWFDVCNAATNAVDTMRGPDATHLASVDAQDFFNFSELRPTLYLDNNNRAYIEWPANEIHCLTTVNHSRDLVFFSGMEPHLRWPTFVNIVLDVINRLKVELVITLGATLAEVPHTRPVKVSGSAPDRKLGAALRLNEPSYEGPTGVTGVLHKRLEDADIPAVSLRASVPHYVAAGPNPMATKALLERFERITGLPTNWVKFDRISPQWESEVNKALSHDEAIIEYLRSLEQRFDKQATKRLPTSEDLGAEFERFLNQQREQQNEN